MANSLKRVKKATHDDESRQDGPREWRCMAHGCPVTAGIEAGAGELICRFHDAAPPKHWNEVTRRLRMRDWMVAAADYYSRHDVAPGWADRAKAAAEGHGRPDLAPTVRELRPGVTRDEREHPALYAQRLNAVLAHECLLEREAPEPTVARSAGPVKLSDALTAVQARQE
jgi:hypothetical protein